MKEEVAMKKRIDARGKTLRAFRAYLDLLATADWIRTEMRGQLESFDVTLAGFRVLEMLYREGPTYMSAASKKLECNHQNLHVIVRVLEDRGFVKRKMETLPLVDNRRNRALKAQGDEGQRGRRVARMRLTRAGRKFIGNLFPRHAKVVKALMRALDGREQETLSKLCRKLREGDDWKYLREFRYLRAGEEFEIDVEDLKLEIEKLRRG
jgi:MarR family 2-MHQ and catechol resistance regulon transcriptional repressor